MNASQDILLYTDATFFDSLKWDKNLACGSAILRTVAPDNLNIKLTTLFTAENPPQAEIETGIIFIRHILSNFENRTIRWYCDLPYLQDLVLKQKVQPSFLVIEKIIHELKALHKKSVLTFHSPKTSAETKYHSLCHRACRLSRDVVQEFSSKITSIDDVKTELERALKEKKSNWMILK